MQKSIDAKAVRIPAIDIVRALAIIGVVFNHTVDGLIGSGLISDASVVAEFNRALYIFRMPALAFVLGLFMQRAADKRGVRGFVREKVTFSCYIYLVWFVLQMLVEIATSSMKNSPRGWDSLLEVWSMPAHLWFMPFLAVAAIVIGLVRPWGTPARTSLTVIGLTVLSLFAWGWNPNFFGLRGLSLLLFTALGSVIGARRLGSSLSRYSLAWICFGAASLSAFVILVQFGLAPGTVALAGDSSGLADSARSIAAAGFGIVSLVSLAVALCYAPVLREGLRLIGTNTLEIYLAHVMVVAGTRILLERLGMTGEVVLPLALIWGIGLPLMLALLAPRLHLSWLFHVPGRLGIWSRAENRMTVGERVHSVQA